MATGTKCKLGSDLSSEFEELSDHDEDDIFEVERILAEDLVEGQTFYLVKWVNYGDHRSTWEPIESFENDDTIKEWRRELANGDSLNKDEVKAVQDRMDAYLEKRKRVEEKQERRRLKRKKQDAEARDRARLQTKQRKVPVDTPNVQTTVKARPNPPKISDAVLNAPPASQRKPSSTAKPPMAPSEPPKFHAIASSKNARRQSPPKSEKRHPSKPAGVKFKSLQHMNNAQKRLNAERTPVTAFQLKPITDLGTSTANEPGRDHSSRIRDDSPLFFPETTRFEPQDRIDVERKQISDDGSVFSGASSPTLTTAPANAAPPLEAAVNSGAAMGPLDPPRIIRTTTGRIFKKDEILVCLKFGDHAAGDVLVLHFPPWLKSMIVSLKEGDLLLLHFEQPMVFSAADYAEISRPWPSETVAAGAIHPFADTAASISDLAQHLEVHDLVALWEYPDENSTIGLILYSPRAKSWSRHATQLNLQGFPLVLEARNRAYRGSKAISVRPKQVVMPRTRFDPTPSLVPRGTASDRPTVPSQPPPIQRLSLDTAVPGLDNMILDMPSMNTPSHTRDSRKARAINSFTTSTLDNEQVATDHQTTPDTPSVVEQASEEPKELDWSVKADFRLMTKTVSSSSGKAFVYIAFAEQHPRQAEAMKDWARKHTSSRFVYTDADGESDWEDFRSGTNTALLLFHEDNPSFCMLKDMYHLLGRDNVVCYNVSWNRETPKEVKYSFSRLSPRGSVLLLTEYTITRHPQETAFALEWFNQHSKKKGWMVMVRPNVRAWLQQTALECEDDKTAKHLFEILRLLFKMSSVADVTIGDDIDRKDFLGIGNSGESEKDNFIVPLPPLAGYDTSPSADGSTEAISKRDDVLLNHFIYWSIMNASSYRRFIALEDLQARKGMEKGAAKPEGAEHIKFWKPEAFMRDQQKSKSSEGEK